MLPATFIAIPPVELTVPGPPVDVTQSCKVSLHVAGRAVPTGAMHCWIYIPALVGNLVKPPLIVAPAGSRFVTGPLAQPNVSACAGAVKLNEEIAIAVAAINERIFIIFLYLMVVYLMEIGM
jgi:hypothetical protein